MRSGGEEEDGEQGARHHKTWRTDYVEMLDALSRTSREETMQAVRAAHGSRNDVSEIYSPPRIAEMAKRMGMVQGFSLDLIVPTPSGYTWDFSKRKCGENAKRWIRELKPYIVIGSPECKGCSTIQFINARTAEGKIRRPGSPGQGV